jgi:hypothetical protein
MRTGVTSLIRASPCFALVMIPACEPVKEREFAPWALIAIARSAIEMRSPEVSSMSISRAESYGLVETV